MESSAEDAYSEEPNSGLRKQKIKQNLVIDKQTFDTMKILSESGDRRNMYEMIYSKRKTLKEDQRLTYFSFWSVCKYPELLNLIIFSTLSTAASGINTTLTQPL